jgi:hypothetical protein
MGTVGWQCDCLAVLAILLDAPGDPDGVGYLKRRVINCTYMAPRFFKEGKVLGGECFYDLAARRVSVVIDLQLGCLHVFADLRAYVLGEGDYVRKKATVWVQVVGVASRLLFFGKDCTIEGSTLLCYVLFFDDVVSDDPSHIIFVIKVNWWSVFSELEERVDCCCLSK